MSQICLTINSEVSMSVIYYAVCVHCGWEGVINQEEEECPECGRIFIDRYGIKGENDAADYE